MSIYTLPNDLSFPVDDGQCDHLRGMEVTDDIILYNKHGKGINLIDICTNAKIVLYVYPMTGRPQIDLPMGWDAIPGARGCTPQACSYRDNIAEFYHSGFSVYGCSIHVLIFA